MNELRERTWQILPCSAKTGEGLQVRKYCIVWFCCYFFIFYKSRRPRTYILYIPIIHLSVRVCVCLCVSISVFLSACLSVCLCGEGLQAGFSYRFFVSLHPFFVLFYISFGHFSFSFFFLLPFIVIFLIFLFFPFIC